MRRRALSCVAYDTPSCTIIVLSWHYLSSSAGVELKNLSGMRGRQQEQKHDIFGAYDSCSSTCQEQECDSDHVG